MNRRRVWGYRLVARELAGLPPAIQAMFLDLTHQLAIENVPPDETWEAGGSTLWIYSRAARGTTYRMAVEVMPEGWIMKWAHGPDPLFRRRLKQRMVWLG